jgi:methionine aminopeptidase
MGIQSVGPTFTLENLHRARDVARDLTYELSSMIRPGMTEPEAHKLYKELSKKHGVQKQWHPPKIRFGSNTLKNFMAVSEPYTLQEEDIFFIDIGPVIFDHEADYGETFTVGSIFDQKHIADCSKKIFDEVSAYFHAHKVTGDVLYEFAKLRADHYGYHLNMGNDGHRIADFPHHVHFKGGLAECPEVVIPNVWILEIHLWNADKSFGAFFEDLLS